MNKSFYYVLHKRKAWGICQKLDSHSVPYWIESSLPNMKARELAIVFPDLPVQQYALVHKWFKKVGKRYPDY